MCYKAQVENAQNCVKGVKIKAKDFSLLTFVNAVYNSIYFLSWTLYPNVSPFVAFSITNTTFSNL